MTDQLMRIPPDSFDYNGSSNPMINIDPPCIPATYLNIETGEVFVCIDNSLGANRWIGQMGTVVEP